MSKKRLPVNYLNFVSPFLQIETTPRNMSAISAIKKFRSRAQFVQKGP